MSRVGARPDPRDQPPAEETEALLAALVATVAERRRLAAATRVRGPGSRRAYVLIEDGGRAWVAVTELGQVLAERTVDTAWLLDQLGAAPRYEDLEGVVGGYSR